MLAITISAYIVLLLVVSYRSRRHSNADEFLIANREASTLQVAAGLFTLIGGGEFVALAALGYVYGWSAIALFVGYGIGFIFLGILSPRIRSGAAEQKFISLPDYVHAHFGKASGLLVFAFSFAAFFALLMLQFSAAGAVITPFLNMPEWQVTIGVGAAVLLYLLIGGFKAVLTTDVIQGIAMILVLPLLLYVAMKGANIDLTEVRTNSEPLPISLWASLLFTGFFVVTASADVWQRSYAAKSDAVAKSGFYIGGASFVLFGFIIIAIGMLGREIGLSDPDTVFVEVMTTHLPESMVTLVALLVLSAMMSTADTETFLLSGLVQHELKRFAPDSRIGSFLESVSGVRLLMSAVALSAVAVAYFYSDLVGIYTWLLSALIVISPIILFSLFYRASSVGMLFALAANTLLFFILVLTDYITLDNIYLIAVPGLAFYLMAAARESLASRQL